jgi:hypothetical protein
MARAWPDRPAARWTAPHDAAAPASVRAVAGLRGQEEIDAAAAVLASGRVNYWTAEECLRFEEEFAAPCGTRHAISLANGTLALELALYMHDIGPGDEVIVPARTFIATASCAVARGARPVVADVDPDSHNLTADTVPAVLTPRTRAMIPVHLAGWPCDMDPIMALARERGIKVIEDCAQAHGATYKGRPVGSLGDLRGLLLLPGQDHDDRRRGRHAGDSNDAAVVEGMGATRTTARAATPCPDREHPPGFRWLHESSAATSA